MKDPYYIKRLERSRAMRKKQRRVRPLSEEIQSTSRLLVWTIGILFLIIMVTFLYVSSQQNAKGYQLKQLQIDNEALLIESRRLQQELNNAKSVNTLNTNDEIENMVDPNDSQTSYIGPANDLAAR